MTQKKPSAPAKGAAPPPNRPAGTRPASPQRRPGGQSAAARRLQSSHRPSERGSQLAWVIGGSLAAIILVFLGVGYYNSNIGPGRDAAIKVGKHTVSVNYFRDRLKAEAVENGDGSQLGSSGAANDITSIVDTIEQEQVYLQRAWSLGLSASDDEIAAQIANIVHVQVTNGKIADLAQYEFEVRGYLERTGLSLAELREIGRAAALTQKVTDYFQAKLPAQAPAFQGTEFTFDTLAAAQAAQKELETGAYVTDLTAELNADSTKGTATPLDWTYIGFGALPRPLDVAAQQLQPGQVSTIIQLDPTTPDGTTQWAMLAVTTKDANHAIDASAQPQLAQSESSAWYTQQSQALGLHNLMSQSDEAWALAHTGLPAEPAATPTSPAGAPTVPSGNPAAPGSQAGPQPPAPSAPAVPSAPAAAP